MDAFLVRTAAGAVHGRAARPLELVAVQPEPDGRAGARLRRRNRQADPADAEPGFPGPGTRALVGLGVDRGGQVAQRGRGVAQRGLVMLRQRGQRGPDDLLVDPVPADHRRRARVGQIQADGPPVPRRPSAPGVRVSNRPTAGRPATSPPSSARAAASGPAGSAGSRGARPCTTAAPAGPPKARGQGRRHARPGA